MTSLKGLQDQVTKLEGQLKTLAATLTTTAIFTNLLIKKVGITRAETDEALLQASLESLTDQRLRSTEAGSNVGDSGYGQPGIYGETSSRTNSAGRTASAVEQGSPSIPNQGSANGDQSAGHEPTPTGRTGTDGAEAQAKD